MLGVLIQKEKAGLLTYKQDELAGVLIGHKLSEKMSNQIITSCENQGIPCLKTKPAPSFSKIKFIPCRADDDFAGYTWDQIDQTVSEDKTLLEETKRL